MIKTLSVLGSCFILAIAAGLSQAPPPASPAAPIRSHGFFPLFEPIDRVCAI